MQKLNTWSHVIHKEIQSEKEKIYAKDYKFYKVDRLERIAVRLDEFSETCVHCDEFKVEVEFLSKSISEMINNDPKLRSEFEKRNEVIVEHLKNTHNLVPEIYFSSRYSFWGILIGLLIGIICSLSISTEYMSEFYILVGFGLGLFVGRIFGMKKDVEARKRNLIL